jgi:hypothetical protein
MAISLDAIYQPLNQFFLKRFGQGEGAPVFFRFAQVPVGFYDSDFVVETHPEWGPLPAVAMEQFSNLVDRIPRLDANGRSLWLDPPRISDLYHDEILGPSRPLIPSDGEAAAREAVFDAFNQIKNDAILKWQNCKAIAGPLNLEFRPSNATPQGWWNKSDPGIWTSQEFKIQGAAVVPAGEPPNRLLRMRISDNELRPMLESHVNLVPSPAVRAVVNTPPRPVMNQPAVLSNRTLTVARPMFAAALAGATVARAPQPAVNRPIAAAVIPVVPQPVPSAALHTDLLARTRAMPVSQRIEVQTMLNRSAPTQPVTVSDVTIGFKYCLVTVARHWMHEAFLNDKSWYIPSQRKGSLSANDGHGIPALPAGFVALKDLRIEGPWTPADITNLEQSVQFGPFIIDSTVVNGAIGHAGIQVVGWILQDLSDLPPIGDPTLT